MAYQPDKIVIPEIETTFGKLGPMSAPEFKKLVQKSFKLFQERAKGCAEFDSLRMRFESLQTQLTDLINSVLRKEATADAALVHPIAASAVQLFATALAPGTSVFPKAESIHGTSTHEYANGFYVGVCGLTNRKMETVSPGGQAAYVLGVADGRAIRSDQLQQNLSDSLEDDQVFDEIERKGERLQDELRAINSQVSAAASSIAAHQQVLEDVEESIKKIRNAEKMLEASLKSTETGLKQQIEDSINLSGPRQQWETRRGECYRQSVIASSLFYLVTGISLYTLVELSRAFLGRTGESWIPFFVALSEQVEPLQVWEKSIAFAVPVAVVIWILRLLARDMISKKHLYEDARHRLTLLETYLSLLAEQSNPATAEERSLILAALFRNIDDGLVKSEPNLYLGPTLKADR